MQSTSIIDVVGPPRAAGAARSFPEHIRRLSERSVSKYYLAYRDVAWDDPANRIDPSDPRFDLADTSPLGASAWYGSLPSEQRSRLGLEMTCQVFKFGIGFELTLSRGLLEFAYTRQNHDPTYRYALHEVLEETQHSLMFQEFIDRSGCEPRPVSAIESFYYRRIARCGATFPELFFMAVLVGELFIDHDNRAQLARGAALHPLLRKIMQIHVTEEARHVHFAELYLREHMPHLSPLRVYFLQLLARRFVSDATRIMLQPPKHLVHRYRIPAKVLRECYGPGSDHARDVREQAARLYALLERP